MLFALAIGTFAFSEILYDWPGADTNHEWVELVNCSSAAVEITGDFRFFDGAGHLIADSVRGNRAIRPGGVFILGADAKTATSTFFADHPDFAGNVFDTVMALGNGGDTLEFRGESGIVLASVSYQTGWGGQGSGKSIEKENPCDGNPNGGWRESSVMGGTPGSALLTAVTIPAPTPAPSPTPAVASPSPTPQQVPVPTSTPTVQPPPAPPAPTSPMPQPTPSPIPSFSPTFVPSQSAEPSPSRSPSPIAPLPLTAPLINEFLPSPAGADAQNEYIELLNPSDAPLDISGWFLDDAEGGSSPYQIPSGTILAPRGILVFPGTATHVALNNDGDSVRLLQPGKIVSQSVAYGKAEEGYVYARGENGAWQWSSLPTPGSANVFAQKPPEVKTEKNVSLGKTTSPPSPYPSVKSFSGSAPDGELDLTDMPARESFFARVGSAEVRSLVLAASVAVSLSLLLIFIRRFL